ncbi:hypothetical protein JHK82_031689 [Glycine max]|uniref:aminobutyraldehyde dehydrogenase n=1 Tax=Glycine max TaxID=3847 RepID=A0A0R0HVR7_SOYBN|nr:hypothetical protein JHK87_031630 [Glycine soja]KAG4989366.1 hypothetical protein JHK85_032349 [Glycine max]KAG4994956.1 hypothetical protein JHK86_031783 [Glycine max]KAG5124952.1 hypothetical protein JHK82_031689 [Glycine max]KAG5146382.1 hypothetical protein JHK84_031925 [Glycine max]
MLERIDPNILFSCSGSSWWFGKSQRLFGTGPEVWNLQTNYLWNCPTTEWTVFGCFFTNGLICNTTCHLIVHESIATKFVNILVQWAKNIKISYPFEEGCRLGPIFSIFFFITSTNVAGEIVEIGQVKDFKVGDKVLAKLNHQVF